jgi:hypothetical protein
MIFVMGITMLKLDRAKAKWRVKLQRAFSDQRQCPSFLFPNLCSCAYNLFFVFRCGSWHKDWEVGTLHPSNDYCLA